ncbi:MAG: YXWGXW repeat-containing protein [Pseudomonadota bacterium]
MKLLFKASLASCGILFLSGCVVVPHNHAPRYVESDSIMIAPPPVREEIVRTAPYPDYVWISGYWGWNGRRHDWVPGHWSAPRPGYRWIPHRWEQNGGSHWHLREGYWERHGRY